MLRNIWDTIYILYGLNSGYFMVFLRIHLQHLLFIMNSLIILIL